MRLRREGWLPVGSCCASVPAAELTTSDLRRTSFACPAATLNLRAALARLGNLAESQRARPEANRGNVIDVAPHGTVEATLGDGLHAIGAQDRVFVAAKVIVRESTPQSAAAGRTQLAGSQKLLQRDRFDLLQVGNLFDVDTQLPTVLDWRDRGQARYAGITVSTSAQYGDLERLARSNPLDFMQLNYSMEHREASTDQTGWEEELASRAHRPKAGGLPVRGYAKGGHVSFAGIAA